MRATDLHKVALSMRQSRGEDWLAIVVMVAAFFVGMFVFMSAAISLLDWLDGRDNSVLPAITAFLDALDNVEMP